MKITLALLWFIFMSYLSHEKGEQTKKRSIMIMSFLPSFMLPYHLIIRKIAHVFLFCVFTLLMMNINSWLFLFALLWGYFDEYTKRNIDGRHCDIEDIMLNILGVGVGIVIKLL